MSQTPLSRALSTLLSELVDGGAGECFVLNPGDPGLLRSLDRLSAEQASLPAPGGGTSIAAHVDHVRYGLELLNRWVAGEENPFATADYSASWRRTVVTDSEWSGLRSRLRMEVLTWSAAVQQVDPSEDLHVTGAIASIVHLAYHLGAIRQIDRSIAGPKAQELPSGRADPET